MLKAVVVGAAGKMGKEIIKGILQSGDIELVGAVDVTACGEDVGELTGAKKVGVTITNDLALFLKNNKVDFIVDFTRRDAAVINIPIAIENGVSVVFGTTGLTPEEMQSFDNAALQKGVGIFFAANYSLGAFLMMKFSQEAAKYFSQVEIIEYHNDKKVDSPSGTAIATARAVKQNFSPNHILREELSSSPCRGGNYDGVNVHSVRLKSMVAHQEVLFAGTGELLTIRHDSFSRESFIPTILIAARKVKSWKGLKIGLDNIL